MTMKSFDRTILRGAFLWGVGSIASTVLAVVNIGSVGLMLMFAALAVLCIIFMVRYLGEYIEATGWSSRS